jgi:Na+-driven multidrug efflux pump
MKGVVFMDIIKLNNKRDLLINCINNETDSKKINKLKYALLNIEQKINYVNSNKPDKTKMYVNSEEYALYKAIKKRDKYKIMGEEEYKDYIQTYDNYIKNLSEKTYKEAKTLLSLDKSKQRRKMILTGNILSTILIICMPIFVYQFFNALYTIIDQIICAKISTVAQNAVSSISQIKNTIGAFGGGLAAGGGVLVSRLYGKGNVCGARHASSNLFSMAIIMSGILMLILIPLAVPIMKLCQVAPESIKLGDTYFRLQMLELAFVSINNIFIGLEKAKGNSKIALNLNILVMTLKLSFTVLFIYGIGLKDIKYVEIATIIGQATLTLIGLYKLFSKSNILRLSLKMMIPSIEYVKPILVLSIPIFLGKFVMSFGKVVVNGMCGKYWNVATEGLIVGTLGVSNNISGLVTSPTNSFEEGESSIVSQNVGAKNMKRTLKVFYRTLILVTIISLAGYILLRFILLDQITDLFTSADAKSETYKTMVKEIFKWDSLSIPSLGICAAVLGLLYGFGQTGLATVLNLSRIGSRILILFTLHKFLPHLSPTFCAGLSMGISNITILVISFIFLFIFLIKTKRKGYNGMKFTDPEPQFMELDLENNKDEINNEEKREMP